jgi:hypothetical protein
LAKVTDGPGKNTNDGSRGNSAGSSQATAISSTPNKTLTLCLCSKETRLKNKINREC